MVEAVDESANLTNFIVTGFCMKRDVSWSVKIRCWSKINTKFRAEWEVLSEELCILASWVLSPMSKNN